MNNWQKIVNPHFFLLRGPGGWRRAHGHVVALGQKIVLLNVGQLRHTVLRGILVLWSQEIFFQRRLSMNWHEYSAQAALREFDVTPEAGLKALPR